MLKIILVMLSVFTIAQASYYERANSAAAEAFDDLDCDFGDCKEEVPPAPKVIIKEKVVYKDRPVVVEKVIVKEKIVYRDRPAEAKKVAQEVAGTFSSCLEIKDSLPHAKSGYYDIFIDNKKYNVYCEMRLASGGWTRVWQADNENYKQTQFDYDLPYSFIENSTYTMISYDNRNRQLSAYNFKTPSDWKVQHPMSYSRGKVIIDAFDSYTNKKYGHRSLYYGFENFSSLCSDNFKGGDWGKVCISATKAPFYASFNHNEKDFCNTSKEAYNTVRCGEKKFSIFMK